MFLNNNFLWHFVNSILAFYLVSAADLRIPHRSVSELHVLIGFGCCKWKGNITLNLDSTLGAKQMRGKIFPSLGYRTWDPSFLARWSNQRSSQTNKNLPLILEQYSVKVKFISEEIFIIWRGNVEDVTYVHKIVFGNLILKNSQAYWRLGWCCLRRSLYSLQIGNYEFNLLWTW
jgi:hypothetical protein